MEVCSKCHPFFTGKQKRICFTYTITDINRTLLIKMCYHFI